MTVGTTTVFGALILAGLAALALLAPWLAPLDTSLYPLTVDLSMANCPPGTDGHPLGTDHLGRDLFGQAVWGARASLAVGILAAGIAVTVGSLWGSLGAMVGGAIGTVMMRVVDGLLSIPPLILLLALQSIVSTPALADALPSQLLNLLRVTSWSYGLLPLVIVIVVVSATNWLEAARLSHAQVLSIKQNEYVSAARAIGVATAGMLRAHILPNAAGVIVVEATLLVSDAVLMEAGLGYLGLGLGPGIPSWGGMLASAQMSLIQGNWWAAAVPGLMITATVLAVNLIGEGSLAPARSRSLHSRSLSRAQRGTSRDDGFR